MAGLSKLEKLMYSIGVVDKATAPVNKIMSKIQQLTSHAGAAQEQMFRGFAGAAGGALMLVSSLNPAIAANQSLGEVSSLEVADTALHQLNNTALSFTSQYGGNAANVISSSYDIQSSIAGLTGDELSNFTKASALMAKGTKSDAATATNYLGTMYGIYQQDAADMGNTPWVEQLAGQTATAVRMYKTNGTEMSSAFTSLGASAQSHGIELAESMAVMGQLQATMSGSEAGTKYRAFLSGVGKAQQELGVSMTDAHGRLLPMPEILDNLTEKMGLIDTVAKSDALKKAFGSEEAVGLIKLLIPQIDQLRGGINKLNEQTGMQTAIDMANAQTDAWQRLSGSFNAVSISLGQAVLPIIEPFVELLAGMLQGVMWLTQTFPTLTGIMATAVVGITGLIVAFGLFNMATGFARFGMIGFTGVTDLMNLAQSRLAISTRLATAELWLRNRATMAANAVTQGYNATLLYSGMLMNRIRALGFVGTLNLLRGATISATTATWGYIRASRGGLLVSGAYKPKPSHDIEFNDGLSHRGLYWRPNIDKRWSHCGHDRGMGLCCCIVYGHLANYFDCRWYCSDCWLGLSLLGANQSILRRLLGRVSGRFRTCSSGIFSTV